MEELGLEDLEELTPKEVLKAEVNLLLFPCFVLSNQEMRKRGATIFRASITKGNEVIELLWQVTGSQKWGHPGPFDKMVFRAIEMLIQRRGYPVKNPVTFSTYELCKLMGKTKSGWMYDRIHQSLDRIAATTIKTRGTFYRKKLKNYWAEGTFHLYDTVYTQGQILPNGSIADRNYIYLNKIYLESLNAQYVRPLDWDYYWSLKRPLSQRLYEILGVKFYGALQQNSFTVRYKYETLCQLLPLARKSFLSQATQQLYLAHKELIDSKFLDSVWWEGWTVYYNAGQRAVEEIEVLGRGFLGP
jgi:plasmid replication initiation protein